MMHGHDGSSLDHGTGLIANWPDALDWATFQSNYGVPDVFRGSGFLPAACRWPQKVTGAASFGRRRSDCGYPRCLNSRATAVGHLQSQMRTSSRVRPAREECVTAGRGTVFIKAFQRGYHIWQ